MAKGIEVNIKTKEVKQTEDTNFVIDDAKAIEEMKQQRIKELQRIIVELHVRRDKYVELGYDTTELDTEIQKYEEELKTLQS